MTAALLQLRHTNGWAAARRPSLHAASTLVEGGRSPAPANTSSLVPASTLAAIAVATAMGTSTIVFSEPAAADVLMSAVIVGLPLLGVVRFGHATLLNFVLWLVVVGCGLAACAISTDMTRAIIHQVVTLYLALGAFVLAGYIAEDPLPRFRLIMNFYVAACLVAAVAGVAGYFGVLPKAHDLFTNYGRARGTFKDPNVLGAALAPAIVYTAWIVLRAPAKKAVIAAVVSLPLILALLLSFSRGAWLSVALSLLAAGWLALVTTRRQRDHVRLVGAGTLGAIGLALVMAMALQLDSVGKLFAERASLEQSYDSGPEGRFGGQAKAVGLILDNPFGIGTFTFATTYHEEQPHNVYLSQFLNAGWLGGTLYIVSVLGTLAAGFYVIRKRNALQGPLIVASAAFAGVALEGLVIDTDHWRHFFLLMALIWGLVDGLPPSHNPKRRLHD